MKHVFVMGCVGALLAGSAWAVTDPAQTNLYRWVHDDLSKPDFYETVNIVNSKWKGSAESLLDPKIPNRSEHEKREDFEEELSENSLRTSLLFFLIKVLLF
jgi:hypothetical protein